MAKEFNLPPNKNGRFKQGYYKPQHPEKYVGDVNSIVYRSRLELRFYKFFDMSSNVLSWACEEFKIEYVSQLDRKVHRYFPDAIIKIKTKGGREKVVMIEIKPKTQCFEPKKPKNVNSKRYINETLTYQKNQDKWQAAINFCKSKGMEFMVLHEDFLKQA